MNLLLGIGLTVVGWYVGRVLVDHGHPFDVFAWLGTAGLGALAGCVLAEWRTSR
jgi:hypothetical protein